MNSRSLMLLGLISKTVKNKNRKNLKATNLIAISGRATDATCGGNGAFSENYPQKPYPN